MLILLRVARALDRNPGKKRQCCRFMRAYPSYSNFLYLSNIAVVGVLLGHIPYSC